MPLFRQIILLNVNPRGLDKLSVSFKLSGGLSLSQENEVWKAQELSEECAASVLTV